MPEKTLAQRVPNLARCRYESVPDDVLLNRYAHELDADAFAELVRRHGPMVLGVCRRVVGHDADADDAFQATFLVLARKARAIRKRDSLASFLHGVSLRAARDIRSRFKDIDRRIADIESYVTTENRSLAREIEQLR